MHEENQREREDLLDTIRAITREIKLCKLIIDQYIPLEHYTTIEHLANYDTTAESWHIDNIHFAGNNVKGNALHLSDKMNVLRQSARSSVRGETRMVKGGWSPNCIFDGIYMRYENARLSDKVSRAQSERSISLSPVKSGRPASASRVRPNSRATSGSPIKNARTTETPKARGLIPKTVRYS